MHRTFADDSSFLRYSVRSELVLRFELADSDELSRVWLMLVGTGTVYYEVQSTNYTEVSVVEAPYGT